MLYVCLTYVPQMYVPHMPSVYALLMCLICMPYPYVPYMYALHVWKKKIPAHSHSTHHFLHLQLVHHLRGRTERERARERERERRRERESARAREREREKERESARARERESARGRARARLLRPTLGNGEGKTDRRRIHACHMRRRIRHSVTERARQTARGERAEEREKSLIKLSVSLPLSLSHVSSSSYDMHVSSSSHDMPYQALCLSSSLPPSLSTSLSHTSVPLSLPLSLTHASLPLCTSLSLYLSLYLSLTHTSLPLSHTHLGVEGRGILHCLQQFSAE